MNLRLLKLKLTGSLKVIKIHLKNQLDDNINPIWTIVSKNPFVKCKIKILAFKDDYIQFKYVDEEDMIRSSHINKILNQFYPYDLKEEKK
jgi:hypothetical protein